MTPTPELMPETVYLEPFIENLSLASVKKFQMDTSYTRTDLYTAACAERDALREFIEQERNAIFYAMTRGQNYDIGLAKERMTATLTAYEKHKEGE